MQEDFAYCDISHLIASTPPEVFFRDDAGRPGGRSRTIVDDGDDSEQEQEKALFCKMCDAPITTDKQRFSKNGKHLHTFFNPAGVVYEIGCFRDAPGCLVHGPVSREFSWFAEHGWQVAFCTVCLEHLGWYFSSSQNAFFGLIINRLRAG